MKKSTQTIMLVSILSLGFFLRFYNLSSIPAGLHADAASQGYNAFSLLHTGKDRYGEAFPILFRSLGSYQPPIYTYLTIIPVALFGNSLFAAHFISALSGLFLVLVTYLLVLLLFNKHKKVSIVALISAFIVAISPWSIFFSRLAVEANLGLLIFALSVLLFVYSLRKIQIFPLAAFTLGISTHAYYSERLIAVIFLPVFILLFRKIFFKDKKWLILAIIFFALTQIPHLLILQSGAFSRRFDQVGLEVSQSDNPFKFLDLTRSAINNYLIYYSPKNLFFDSDTNLGRTMPNLSVFYNWTIVPFLIGLWSLVKKYRTSDIIKILGLLLIITPLPASFTGDFFYPLRTLDFLWVLTLVISIGLVQIYLIIKSNLTRLILSAVLLVYSLFSLYISYFVLFKYEKAENYGYPYMKLMNKLSEYRDKQIIVDLSRDPGVGVRIAYLKSFSPKKVQDQLRPQLKTPYYSSLVNLEELYKIENIEVKPLSFADACKNDLLIIGDTLSISLQQAEEHNLKLEFEIQDLSGKVSLRGYSTNPQKACI